MICKPVSYELAIDEWKNLLDNGSLPAAEQSIARAHLAGLKAEKEMAYYLDARFGGNKELLVFNNLKFEHRGLTAQIDHLVLTRWAAYFIETKSVSQKININADGQWARVYGRKYRDMESPIEQSRRHQAILFDLLDDRLTEFMGKFLGMQLKYRGVIDVHHLVAVSVGASIRGKGKKAIAEHIRPLDQIPQMIADRHNQVRASFLGSVIAEIADKKTRKRQPAFSEKELDACRQLLLEVDISSTPLEQVHRYIEELPQQAADLHDAEAPDTQPTPASTPAQPAPQTSPAPACPKCGGEMALRTAKRGDRAGQHFYGCTNYPKCRGIINTV